MTVSATPPTSEPAQELPYPSCQVPARTLDTQDAQLKTNGPAPQPRRWKPTATWVILGVCILVWGLDAAISLTRTVLWHEPVPPLLLDLCVKDNAGILRGEVWRLVTPIFCHVGFMHIAFNAYAIYMIGPQIECFFGPSRFLSVYLLSGIYGVFLSFALSAAPSAGASGAIFGLIGTQAVFFYRYRDAFGQHGRRQLYNTLSIIAFNLVLTFSASNIDIYGHIGGLLAGAVLGWSLMPDYALVQGEAGQQLVDRNHPRRWGRTVLGATGVLIVSTLLTVVVQRARLL